MNHEHLHDHSAISTTVSVDHAHHMMAGHMMKNNVSMGHGMKDMMGMAMTFHGGYKEQILFDQWNTQSVGAFVASWFAVFFLAVLYEGLKTLRDYLSRREALAQTSQNATRQNQGMARLLTVPHFIQTLLHMIQMSMSYLLMLVAMTYNSYLFFAVVLGAGLGHFLFGWSRSTVIDYNEHCH